MENQRFVTKKLTTLSTTDMVFLLQLTRTKLQKFDLYLKKAA